MLIISRGSIFHWKRYSFEDGTTRDKYWISFTCEVGGFPKIIVLPTSRIEKYESNRQSFIDTYVIKEGSSRFFSKDTVIDFKNRRMESKEDILQAHENGRFTYMGQLEEEIIQAVNEVIENAETLSPQLIEKLLCR